MNVKYRNIMCPFAIGNCEMKMAKFQISGNYYYKKINI